MTLPIRDFFAWVAKHEDLIRREYREHVVAHQENRNEENQEHRA